MKKQRTFETTDILNKTQFTHTTIQNTNCSLAHSHLIYTQTCTLNRLYPDKPLTHDSNQHTNMRNATYNNNTVLARNTAFQWSVS